MGKAIGLLLIILFRGGLGAVVAGLALLGAIWGLYHLLRFLFGGGGGDDGGSGGGWQGTGNPSM